MNISKGTRAALKASLTRFNRRIESSDIEDLIRLSQDIKDREYNWEYECDPESLVCKYLSPTTWESFCRFGDRNRATEAMILRWIRKDGEPLDVQAIWLSHDSGKEFRPESFAEFMMENDLGCNYFPYHKQTNELKAVFKELTGFNWSYKLHNYLESFHLTNAVIMAPMESQENPF
jgi:hypothetical protein